MRLKPLRTIAFAAALAAGPALAMTDIDVLSGAVGLDEREQMMQRYTTTTSSSRVAATPASSSPTSG